MARCICINVRSMGGGILLFVFFARGSWLGWCHVVQRKESVKKRLAWFRVWKTRQHPANSCLARQHPALPVAGQLPLAAEARSTCNWSLLAVTRVRPGSRPKLCARILTASWCDCGSWKRGKEDINLLPRCWDVLSRFGGFNYTFEVWAQLTWRRKSFHNQLFVGLDFRECSLCSGRSNNHNKTES